MDISVLKGKTIIKIDGYVGGDELIFHINDHEKYMMYHQQDCCESVIIEDICGELEWLIGQPILVAEERVSHDAPEGITESRDSSESWTFYELATLKGSVTIRWYGSSNGYYSESVDFIRIQHE